MKRNILIMVFSFCALTACHMSPPDPTRVKFVLADKNMELSPGYKTQCEIYKINGNNPNGVAYLTSETYGQKKLIVQCLIAEPGYFQSKHLFFYYFDLNTQPGSIFRLRTQSTPTTRYAWFESNDGVKLTPIVNGIPTQ